ncbi:hypothetical protein HanRHA438_Chr17g0823291 [Helianthus annuus]|nr:hypothetical protein HanRHA438_Chr17g0823291 [Helianthus annuus]
MFLVQYLFILHNLVSSHTFQNLLSWFLVVPCRTNRRIVFSLIMFKTGVCLFYG